MIIIEVLFWLCIFLVGFSYLIYPLLLQLLVLFKMKEFSAFSAAATAAELPVVHVVFAAYNEEKIISQKLISIFNSDYPQEKLHVWIGSDASLDKTDDIISEYAQRHPLLHFYRSNERSGKSGILNHLFKLIRNASASQDVVVLTDANVIFKRNTLKELVKYFADPDVGLVGAVIANTNAGTGGIAFQEKSYIKRENAIKHREGQIWGAMIGAFGACYAVRADLLPDIPPNTLMEDFHISLSVLEKGKKAIANPDAVATEDLPDRLSEEFKRKVRISAGNFQNLSRYKKLLWPPFNGVAFAFLSHKVLRWFGPFLLLLALLLNAVLAAGNQFYMALLLLQVLLIILAVFDLMLKQIGVNLIVIRFISYFYAMNLALLFGFFKYIKGIKTNVWQPTNRDNVTI